MDLIEIGSKAKEAQRAGAILNTKQKNDLLEKCADALEANAKELIAANAIDMEKAVANNMPQGLQDRLL